MKRLILLASAAVIVVASCNKQDPSLPVSTGGPATCDSANMPYHTTGKPSTHPPYE